MKRWLWWTIVGITVAIVFIGFGYTKGIETQKNYNMMMQRGQKDIEKGQYDAAMLNFRDALKKKQSDEKAKIYLRQTRIYKESLEQLKKKDYAKSRLNFQVVASIDGGSSVLVRRASEKQTELKEVIKELKLFNKTYTKAKKLSQKYQYTASNTKLAVILGYGNIKQSYYTEIRKKAKKLQTYNNRILRRLGYTVDSDADNSSPKVSQKPNITVTQKEIEQAKKDLKSQNVDTTTFTPTKVRDVVLRARRQNKTVKQIAHYYK